MSRHPDFAALLPAVTLAAEAAGSRLAAEFTRPHGPRGRGHHADIDEELEQTLRAALHALLPDANLVGEEAGAGPTKASHLCWLIDPHDGTAAYLQGHRGTAVSIALLEDGVPVLGVVHAPLPPDRAADTIAWAAGMDHLLRNGEAVAPALAGHGLEAGRVVFVSQAASDYPQGNGLLVAPARFIALPSIAYRLARVAAGDGVAAVSLNSPVGWDYAAGDALLRGAGGVLLNEAGQEVRYSAQGSSGVRSCFGGAPAAAAALAARPWGEVTRREKRSAPRIRLDWPRVPADIALDRAVGCLLGQVVGDSLGALVEFQSAAAIARQYPLGVRDLADGGTWNTLAGQPTDDTELALALARVLAQAEVFNQEAVAEAYGAWVNSKPFDIGGTTRQGLGAAARAVDGNRANTAIQAASRTSQANGSLMRVAGIGIWARSPEEAAEAARADSSLSHPHPVCLDSCAAFCAAIAAAVGGADRKTMLEAAKGEAKEPAVVAALQAAEAGKAPSDFQTQQGWVLVALQNAFFHLAHTKGVEAALIETVGRGGDTDTNGAICGALMGAAVGRNGFPARWVMPVMACRPLAKLGAHQARSQEYWPDDVPQIAEALLRRRLSLV